MATKKKKIQSYWDKTGKYQVLYDELNEKLVPNMGEAETKHGELLRNIGNLYYDYLNNGFCNLANRRDEIDNLQANIGRVSTDPKETDKLQLVISDMFEMARLNAKGKFYPMKSNKRWAYNGSFNRNFDLLIDAVVLYVQKMDKETALNSNLQPS